MSRKFMRLLIVASSMLVLVACGGSANTKEDQDPAAVEDQSTESTTVASIPKDGASTQTLQGGAVGIHALDDPESPLFKRIIYFEFDSSDIRAEDRSVVEAHARYLADHPGASVTLEGHADERGSREYNIALGENRAVGIRRLITLLGASGDQTRTVSYGEERPAVLGHEDTSWSLNRRVELVYSTR